MEKIILKTAFLAILFVYGVVSLRTIKVENQYDHDIWIQSLNNPEYSPLFGGRVVKLRPGTQFTYNITDRGWAGRFWPKTKCNARGEDCEFGQSMIPCPTGGCHPPADTKVEFFFPPNGDSRASYYDISLVDGYSLGAKIIPYHNGRQYQHGSCVITDCQVKLEDCPDNERNGLGGLTARGRRNNAVACLAPCKKWNYPQPWGLGLNEQHGDGRMLCCPHPVSPEDCRRGIVVNTEYVNLIHRVCRKAYSYSYDDEGGLHNCPSAVSYRVKFHP